MSEINTIQKTSLLKKLYLTFWTTSLIIFFIGIPYRNQPDENIDINFVDTYYVIAFFQLTTFFALFYFLIGFGYWLVNRLKGRLNKILLFVHAIIMLGSFIGILIIWNVIDEYDILRNTAFLISLTLILFIAQPIYVINLMLGLFNWRKDRKAKF